MNLVIHPRITAAMTAAYIAGALLAFALIRDRTLLALAIFLLFFLAILSGNVLVRRSGRAPAPPRAARSPADPEAGPERRRWE